MTSDNWLIQGDNLEVTRQLERLYTGKIKCIYIDPPYNTKKKWNHYNDNMKSTEWLEFMRVRLEVLRRLLRDDGSIWISIDDDECHYLKVLCDEVFGRKNFVANVIWQKKSAPQNDARYLSDTHDHVLIYAKDAARANAKKWLLPRTEEMNARYKNPDSDPRGAWQSDNLSVKTYSAACDYPIKTPSGRVVYPPAGGCWRVSKSRLRELVADDRIWFGKDGCNVPRLKRFMSEVQQGVVAKTIWMRDEVGDNQEAKREVKAFNSAEVFQTPKPERLLQRILHLATDPGDIVLDSFAGSGTTGAVAHKMDRRWIMVELGDHCHSHIMPRMHQVIDGTDQGGVSKDVKWTGGGEYKFIDLKTKDLSNELQAQA